MLNTYLHQLELCTLIMVDSSTMTDMSMICIEVLEQECVSNRSSSLSDTCTIGNEFTSTNVCTSRGKKQWSKLEVDTSCQLSRVWIHIESIQCWNQRYL